MMFPMYIFTLFGIAADASSWDISTDHLDSTNTEFYLSTDSILRTTNIMESTKEIKAGVSSPLSTTTSTMSMESWNLPVCETVTPTTLLKDSPTSILSTQFSSWTYWSVTPTVYQMESLSGLMEEHCVCRCEEDAEAARQRVNRYVMEIKTNLSVARNTTTRYLRKRISVVDQRPSAQTVGLAGISLCCITLGLLVMCDCVGVVQRCVKLKKSWKRK